MKKRIMMFMVAGFFVIESEAKSKKNKRVGSSSAQSVGVGVMPGGVGVVPGAPSVAVGQAKTDQQFLEEQLRGMQQTKTNELRERLREAKMKNADNKKLIDQLLSEIVSGKVILYQK